MYCASAHDYIITASQCDFTGRLGIAQCLDMFMDAASRHADEMLMGRRELAEKDLFWMITKNRIRIYRMPEMSDTVTLTTWPLRPDKLHNDRCYTLKKDGELLAVGKCEWVNYNFVTGKLSPVSALFAPDDEFCTDDTIPEGFDRIGGEFPEQVCEYKVRTSDVDVNSHVNNTKYVYALLDIYSSAELKAHPIKEAEMIYKNQTKEGETLLINRRPGPDGAEDYKITSGDKTALFARFIRG